MNDGKKFNNNKKTQKTLDFAIDVYVHVFIYILSWKISLVFFIYWIYKMGLIWSFKISKDV